MFNEVNIKTAIVKAVKQSAVRKRVYYITVDDGFGEIKVVGNKSYNIGEKIKIKRRNPVDWIWDIVKEK